MSSRVSKNNHSISQDTRSLISKRYKRITKAVNTEFWNSNSETTHSCYVGSYGRGTAINTSDLDVLIELPDDEYDHFTNGMLQGNAEKFLKILGDTGFVRAFYEVIKENLEIANPPLERFFATGVAPVTLDSLTSGFNITTKITTVFFLLIT